MIQNYVSPYSSDGYQLTQVAFPAAGSSGPSPTLDTVGINCLGTIVDVLTFGVEQVFKVLGPDDHVFTFLTGFDGPASQSFYQYVLAYYLDSSGATVRRVEIPLAGSVGSFVKEGAFSVPSHRDLGAVSIRIVVYSSIRGAGYCRVNTDLRYAKPRKLLQYGK